MPPLPNFSLNKKNNTLAKVLILAGVLIVAFVLLNFFGLQIKNSFYLASYPIEKVFFAAGESSSGFLGSFFKAGILAKENESLKNENQKLLAQISYFQEIEQNGQDQTAALFSCLDRGFQLSMAEVIGLDEQDMLSIDKGSANGIAVGMPVINGQNVLFGKVFKVYKNFSKVMLLSNPSSLIDVAVQQSDPAAPKIYGAVKGKGGMAVYLDLVPVDQEIKEGDILITSALEGTFPKDLLVGKITKKEKNDQKAFQQAQVEPFLSLKNIDNLFVITNYKQEQ